MCMFMRQSCWSHWRACCWTSAIVRTKRPEMNLYKNEAKDSNIVFAAPQLAAFLRQFFRQKLPFAAPFVSKFCAAAKTPQNLTKCRVCGVFAACISQKTFKNTKNPFFCAFHLLGLFTLVGQWLNV